MLPVMLCYLNIHYHHAAQQSHRVPNVRNNALALPEADVVVNIKVRKDDFASKKRKEIQTTLKAKLKILSILLQTKLKGYLSGRQF